MKTIIKAIIKKLEARKHFYVINFNREMIDQFRWRIRLWNGILKAL